MAQDLTLDYLIVSRREAPPDAALLTRALAGAGLGVFDYTPATPRPDAQPASSGRTRIATYSGSLPETAATARLIVFRYDEPVTTGMGEKAFADLTQGLAEADVQTLRDGAMALDLRITTTDAEATRALTWATRALTLLLDLTDGVCIDPAAQRAQGRRELGQMAAGDALAHVAFHNVPWDPETRWIHTHGLQKFGRPELELLAVPLSLQPEAMTFLREVAASLAGGARLVAGSEIDMAELGTVLGISATPDVDHQAPFGRLTLVDTPLPGEAEGIQVTRLLVRMVLAAASRALESGHPGAASEDVERLLAANPEDCAALLLKGRILLRAGRIDEALGLGEFMELRVPEDYRGALLMGEALAALGRYREALHALNRAIEREPEAAEAYLARAEVHERLGERQLGAMDRAHASYLAQVSS